MLRIDGIDEKEWLSIAENLWEKVWEIEWLRIRFVDGSVIIDPGYVHLEASEISGWIGRCVYITDDEPDGGMIYIFHDNDG